MIPKPDVQPGYAQWLHEFQPKLISRLRKGYTFSSFHSDAIAGITVAVVSFPLAMALAVAAGTTPDHGLASAIVGGFLISLLGGSRTQISGPAAAFVVVIYDVIQRYGYDGLLLATVIAGFLLILAGLARLGSIIKYVPYSVITGFTTGLAVVIFTGQLRDFLGLSVDQMPALFWERWDVLFRSFRSFQMETTLLALGSLAAILYIRKFHHRIPVLLFVIAATGGLVFFFQLDVVTMGRKFGAIPSLLPSPHLPPLSFQKLVHVFPAALTIAFLAGIEALLGATIADSLTGDRHRSNIELIAQGIGNLVSPFFGGIPVTATFTRTATNIHCGAKTPISGLVHALAIFAMMTFFAPLVAFIPLPTLAAISVIIAWDMSSLSKFYGLLRIADNERIVMLLTFFLTIFADIGIAIQAGIISSSFFFVQRMSRLTSVTPEDHDDEEHYEIPAQVRIYHIQGPFFFGAASRIKAILDQYSAENQTIYILNLRDMPLIDATGVNVLSAFVQKCDKRQITVIIAALNTQPYHTLKRMGVHQIVPRERLTRTLEEAITLSRQMIAQAESEMQTSP